MSIEFVAGNVFTYPGLQGWAHGCNCQGAMGAGIAVEFRRRFPDMYDSYARMCRAGAYKPGDCYSYSTDEVTVFNLATQESWKAQLDWIETAVQNMLRQAKVLGVTSIGFPAIGAGLGGLQWADVKAVLQKLGDQTDVRLVCLETFVP